MQLDSVREIVGRALGPGCFFVATPARLRIEHVESEQVRWEIFRGHLLDPAHAQEVRDFESWHLYVDSAEDLASTPLISLRWQLTTQQLFLTRQILTHGFEAYEDSPGVILTRTVEKWVSELIGTLDVGELTEQAFDAELAAYVFLAVVGTSRLPITSSESPPPAFSLGQLGYVPQLSDSSEAWTDPVAFFEATVQRSTDQRSIEIVQQAKSLETALRSLSDSALPELVRALKKMATNRPDGADRIASLMRTMFNHVALSPYTQFADRLIALLLALSKTEPVGVPVVVDLMSFMLRHLCRHLTAFDLTLFHNFGANYPDALFLDSLLKAYLGLIGQHIELFSDDSKDTQDIERLKRLRRRALRQASLVRLQYEGHRVPDVPTSMGESMRVLPAPFVRVPEEQIIQMNKRTRLLYEGEAMASLLTKTGRRVLTESIADLAHPIELRELGMAQFLDRPLGVLKQPGEVDRTPLLSYEAFSRAAVKRRLAQMKTAGWISTEQRAAYVAVVSEMRTQGMPAASISALDRPGVVSLLDAQKAAADFIFLRTTRKTVAELLSHYDLEPFSVASPQTFAWLMSEEPILLLQDLTQDGFFVRAKLKGYDQRGQPRLELALAPQIGSVTYCERSGIELPTRLQLLRIWEAVDLDQFVERELSDPAVWLNLR